MMGETRARAQVPEEQKRARADRLWMGRAARLFCIGIAIVGGYFLFAWALPLLLPFILALLLAVPVRRGAARMQQRLGIPQRLGAVVLLLFSLLLLVTLTVLLGERLIYEGQRLLSWLQSDSAGLTDKIENAIDFFTRITSHIPPLEDLVEQQSLENFWQQVDATVAALLGDLLTRLSSRIPEALGAFLRALPSAIIFFLTFLISVFYCATDDGRITSFFSELIPPLWRDRLVQLRRRSAGVVARYLRAYLLLFLLTFAELFFGFSALGLPYTFLPALLIAVVDILPVLGVGTVLIPWGVIELWQGNTFVGVGLLILCAVILLLRQILEPRIIGNSLGLHPLATLAAAYVGLRTAGVLGVIAAPPIAMLLKSILTNSDASASGGMCGRGDAR